jgi:hypothetical protein
MIPETYSNQSLLRINVSTGKYMDMVESVRAVLNPLAWTKTKY